MIKATSSFPVFIVKNLNEAKIFYSDHFEFSVGFENEWYLHLVSESGIQIGFMLPDLSIQPDIFHPAYDGNGVIFSLEVDDADQAYSDAKGKSLDIVLELRSEEWGQRHFCVKDPNGIYLDIVQPIDPTGEYQQGYETE